MLSEILDTGRESYFDVRAHASPDDGDRDALRDQLGDYKLLWAISKVVQPASILEIGVGFGYGAAALLDASPTARFVGIDVPGVSPSAQRWAARHLAAFDAELLVAEEPWLVGASDRDYDLVHLNVGRDADRTYRCLELAAGRARWVVVDGYFADLATSQAANAFAFKNPSLVEQGLVLGAGAGRLLLRIDDQARERLQGRSVSGSEELRAAYTSTYFLTDCGGYESFRRTNGQRLEDPRLVAVAAIASVEPPRRVLDIGCGRGELAQWFAERGAEVVAVDYSAAAIELARAGVADRSELAERITFVCASALTAPLEGAFDLVVASDVVEHLAPGELAQLYARVASVLAPAGRFVVHTYPNRLYYERQYPKVREQAAGLGAYLAPEPRTEYERLMHINEQEPDRLRKQLHEHFAELVLWVGSPHDPGCGLLRDVTAEEAETYPDIFAVASHAAIDLMRLGSALTTPVLDPAELERCELRLGAAPVDVASGSGFEVECELHNGTHHRLMSTAPHPVHLSYHWYGADGGCLVFEGRRSQLAPWVEPGRTASQRVAVTAPPLPGRHRLRLVLVQEGVAWFDDPALRCVAETEISVARARR